MGIEFLGMELSGNTIAEGVAMGFCAYFVLRHVVFGIYTVDQNERAVKTSFGRAHRLGERTTVSLPIAETLREDEKKRYDYPQVEVIGPGGPYFRWPWQKIYKVSIATCTTNMAWDPDDPRANHNGTQLEAVTKDQLNTGLTGDIRYRASELNLYAYIFGIKNPLAHIMGYFVSVLRQRIANFEAPRKDAAGAASILGEAASVQGVSINDLRKNLRDINDHMDQECRSSEARYGMVLDASLITGIDPPAEVESALAAINTAHNQVSSDISLAQAGADQKIVQSQRAVEIETLRAQAEVQPLIAMASQLAELKRSGKDALRSYRRFVRLDLFAKAERAIREVPQ
ncbi:MAG: SPFH domain-containing protein [Myxococcota bacterium]|jgi:regulator of protease activity HflC (stomatin/prohibitin superfamily)|nr:SPFH domain-containing protein [Myxococcota bacterium]